MATIIYNCTQNNNRCPKKDSCKRYIQAKDNEYSASLSKMACTENNNYLLYIKYEQKEDDSNNGQNQTT